MQRQYLIGASVKSTATEVYQDLCRMYNQRMIDHIQVLIIPKADRLFHHDLGLLAEQDARIIIHAPHHGQGVNPCAPSAYDSRSKQEIGEYLDQAMNQTYEAADTLRAGLIVLHAGWFEEGERASASAGFSEFLDRHHDPRLILENLPARFRGRPMLGTTVDELKMLAGGRVRGFCLDFAHLYCAANSLGRSFREELIRFEDLPVGLHHLSNTKAGSTSDLHLALDHPEGGMPLDQVVRSVIKRPEVHTSLEYRHDAVFYARQLLVFEDFFKKYLRR